jgi:hypothetical protein
MKQCLLQTDYKIMKCINKEEMLVFLFCSVDFIIILLSDIVKEGAIVVDEGPWIAIILFW